MKSTIFVATICFSILLCACSAIATIHYTVTDLGQAASHSQFVSGGFFSLNATGQLTSVWLSSSEATLWNPTTPNGTSGTTY